MQSVPAHVDIDTEVAILGSGAAGLTAALRASADGADVVVLEKADRAGGTTAISAGVVWVPNNHHMAADGIADSEGEALAYLESLSLGLMDGELAASFVEAAPAMLRQVEERSPCRFHVARGYPDYHPEHPGAKPAGGRSLDNDLFPFASLGSWQARVQAAGPPLPLTMDELTGAASFPGADEMAERGRRDERGMGQALAGGLLKGCLDQDVPIVTGARAVELLFEDGQVAGLRARRHDRDLTVRARRGVLLATGGFEWNADLVRTFLRGPMQAPLSLPESVGEGLVMAMQAGAGLANMSEAWWAPAFQAPADGPPRYLLCMLERTRPHSLMVNRAGRRFVNEAANYNDLGRAFHAFDATAFAFPNVPAWLVFDAEYAEKYCRQGPTADLMRAGAARSAASAAELAGVLGIDERALRRTLARFNRFAARGVDPDFHRGRSLYDRFNGDRSREGALATLGPVATPPFHALEVVPGSLGTKGGPRANRHAQVLDARGRVIPGLYAAGNVSAACGMAYWGAGATLGFGMTFGYLAGGHLAGRRVGRAIGRAGAGQRS